MVYDRKGSDRQSGNHCPSAGHCDIAHLLGTKSSLQGQRSRRVGKRGHKQGHLGRYREHCFWHGDGEETKSITIDRLVVPRILERDMQTWLAIGYSQQNRLSAKLRPGKIRFLAAPSFQVGRDSLATSPSPSPFPPPPLHHDRLTVEQIRPFAICDAPCTLKSHTLPARAASTCARQQ